jgi:hypothetical protein
MLKKNLPGTKVQFFDYSNKIARCFQSNLAYSAPPGAIAESSLKFSVSNALFSCSFEEE